MKILFLSLITISLLAFSSKVSFNSSDKSTEIVAEQTIQYKNGTTSKRSLSIVDIKKLDASKNSLDVSNCTYSTPSGGCSSTASTCSAALGMFADCLCKEGYSNWCLISTAPAPPTSTE